MRTRAIAVVLAALSLSLAVQLDGRGAAVAEQDVYDYIRNQLQVSGQTKELLLAAFKDGFAKGRLTPDAALRLLRRIESSGAALEHRDAVLRTIAETLLADRPVEMLLSKVEEGLIKGVPMDAILAEVQERAVTIAEVQLLLYAKGIRAGAQIPGMDQKLNLSVVDVVVTDIAGALEDYVRAGKNPQDAAAVRLEAMGRLERDGRVPAALTNYIRTTVSDLELSRLAQHVAERLKKQK